jgi:hypothetical protein
MGSVWMWLLAIKDLRDRFTLAGSERGDVHESFYSVLGRPSNHCPGVRMPNEYYGPVGSLQCSRESGYVISERCQREWSADDIKAQTSQG